MKSSSSKTAVIVSLCGLFAAMSVVIMLAAYLGPMTYALPAIAGALLIIIYIELGVKNALTVFLAVSVLSFLICEKEASLCYCLFFGYYPVLKAYIEKIPKKPIQWTVKIVWFTAAFALIFWLGAFVFGIPIDDMGYGRWGIAALFAALEVMFIVYDIALTRVITLYILRYRDKFRKMMRLNKK